MKTFDNLLDEVLRHDSNQEPPPAMERRILATLSKKKGDSPLRAAIGVGMAAAIVIGVLGLATIREIEKTQSGDPTASTQRPRAAVLPDLARNEPLTIAIPNSKASGLAVTPQTMARRRPTLLSHAIRISPVNVEPLVIAPIQIASLTAGPTAKGKTR